MSSVTPARRLQRNIHSIRPNNGASLCDDPDAGPFKLVLPRLRSRALLAFSLERVYA